MNLKINTTIFLNITIFTITSSEKWKLLVLASFKHRLFLMGLQVVGNTSFSKHAKTTFSLFAGLIKYSFREMKKKRWSIEILYLILMENKKNYFHLPLSCSNVITGRVIVVVSNRNSGKWLVCQLMFRWKELFITFLKVKWNLLNDDEMKFFSKLHLTCSSPTKQNTHLTKQLKILENSLLHNLWLSQLTKVEIICRLLLITLI